MELDLQSIIRQTLGNGSNHLAESITRHALNFIHILFGDAGTVAPELDRLRSVIPTVDRMITCMDPT